MDINPTKVSYKAAQTVEQAKELLKEVAKYDLIACDFETTTRYTEEQYAALREIAETNESYTERKRALSVIAATALDHPEHIEITHCSIAVSETEGYVFIFADDHTARAVLTYLLTTKSKQVWHNAVYDLSILYYLSDKMPSDIEDTAIFARSLFNHTEKHKARVGLKELAGTKYGAWAIAPDSFTKDHMYDPKVLLYAATDACATFYVWQRMHSATKDDMSLIRSTADTEYSPWDQLATAPSPKGATYPEAYFYHNTGKHLVKDTVRLSLTGLPTTLEGVYELEKQIDQILDKVHKDIADNAYVRRYLEAKYKYLVQSYKDAQKAKCKSPDNFLKEYDNKSAVHRSYYMELFAHEVGIALPEEKLPSGVSKWSARLVKKLSADYPALGIVVSNSVPAGSARAQKAMHMLAADKAKVYNEKYLQNISSPKVDIPVFNPASALQKQEIFSMLNLESDVKTGAGADSWSRDQIELLNKMTSDEDLKKLTESMIDYSFTAIIKGTFIPAFYRYSYKDRLYGKYNLFGAKTMRFTSSNPNMLNLPSTKSRFSKPVKKLFIAPKKRIVAAIDYAALEDRVIANLSEDQNKLDIFLKNVDGHSQAAYFYWPDEVSPYIGEVGSVTEAAIKFKKLVDEGHTELDEIRKKGKTISFGLAYGCGAKKVSIAAKLPIEEAEAIYNAYHNKLFPGITKYREEYVLKTALEQGYIHMGLGARIYTDNPNTDIRTLSNSTCQFWSILSLLTINKLYKEIDKAGYQEEIKITSSIYDSIYFDIEDNPEVIKWLNDKVVPIMEVQYMQGQILPNSVDLEIGPDWATLHKLPHNATVNEIKEVRSKW